MNTKIRVPNWSEAAKRAMLNKTSPRADLGEKGAFTFSLVVRFAKCGSADLYAYVVNSIQPKQYVLEGLAELAKVGYCDHTETRHNGVVVSQVFKFYPMKAYLEK